MWYVKFKEVSSAEIKHQIEDALNNNEMSLDDLLRKLAYIKLQDGRDRFERLYAGAEDDQLLRRVAGYLGLDYLSLSGEIAFEEMVDYLKFTFAPILLRVPERTRPSQIFPVAFAGVNAFIQVGRYPKLLDVSLSDHHSFISLKIKEDYANRAFVPLFGAIVGYAYFYEFCKAKAYSIDGEEITDYEIVPITVNAVLRKSKSAIASHGGIIPRLKNKIDW